jgi:hypothetical protein
LANDARDVGAFNDGGSVLVLRAAIKYRVGGDGEPL